MRWMTAKGIDPRRDAMEVGIAFQCLNGGVRMTDTAASATISGLFVIGELAGGVRGPDRPGGNSLAESQVFGHRAGNGAARYAAARAETGTPDGEPVAERLAQALRPGTGFSAAVLAEDLRRAMQTHCLVEKNAAGMAEALKIVHQIRELLAQGGGASPANVMDLLSLDNMATTAGIILAACLRRQESRSSHYRTDFPQRDDAGSAHSVVLQRDGNDIRFSALDYPHSDQQH